jgi:hypothetical protein
MKQEDFNRVSLHSNDSREEVVATIKLFTNFTNSIKVVVRIRDIKKQKKLRNKLLKNYSNADLKAIVNREVQLLDFHDNDTIISVTDGIRIGYALVDEINRRVGLKLYEI